MTISRNTRELLRVDLMKHEGVKRYPYKCTAGKLTIGVGRNLDDRGLSDEEIQYLLDNDIDSVEREIYRAVPSFDSLTENRQRALLNLAFNIGIPRMLTFKRMLAAIRDNDFEAAGKELIDSRYEKQVGQRAYDVRKLLVEG